MTHPFNAPLGDADVEQLAVAGREFLVTTADAAPDTRLRSVGILLRRVREIFKMDVVFVSQFLHGRRVFRHVDAGSGAKVQLMVGSSDPLEESYCQQVVDGRLPSTIPDARKHPVTAAMPATEAVDVGAHLSVAIVLAGGETYGTLCCFSHQPNPWMVERDAQALRSVAQLLSETLDPPGDERVPESASPATRHG